MKMNKTETIEFARKLASKNEAVNKMTGHEVEKLEWQERQIIAHNLLLQEEHWDRNSRYASDFGVAYENTITNVMGNKVRELKNARDAWKRATTGISSDEAARRARALIESMNIRGVRIDGETSLHSVSINRSEPGRWNEDARAYFRLERVYDGSQTVVNPDDEKQYAGVYNMRIEMSTAGTSYSTAKMAVIIKAQQELLDAMTELEVVLANERIVWTRGIPEAPATTDGGAQ